MTDGTAAPGNGHAGKRPLLCHQEHSGREAAAPPGQRAAGVRPCPRRPGTPFANTHFAFDVRVTPGLDAEQQTEVNSIKGKQSYSSFYQPGIWLIVFGGEMRESEPNLTIRSNYSKRKMNWVVIAAKLMGFMQIHPLPAELPRHCAPHPARPGRVFKCWSNSRSRSPSPGGSGELEAGAAAPQPSDPLLRAANQLSGTHGDGLVLPDAALTRSRGPSKHQRISCALFSVGQLNTLTKQDVNELRLFRGEPRCLDCKRSPFGG